MSRGRILRSARGNSATAAGRGDFFRGRFWSGFGRGFFGGDRSFFGCRRRFFGFGCRRFVFAFGFGRFVAFVFARFAVEFFARFLGRFARRFFSGVFGLDVAPGGDHAGPDQRREGAAHHRTAVVEGGHRRRRVGIADPDAGGDFVFDAAAEPGVAVVLGRPGLAPLAFGADLGVGPGA